LSNLRHSAICEDFRLVMKLAPPETKSATSVECRGHQAAVEPAPSRGAASDPGAEDRRGFEHWRTRGFLR